MVKGEVLFKEYWDCLIERSFAAQGQIMCAKYQPA